MARRSRTPAEARRRRPVRPPRAARTPRPAGSVIRITRARRRAVARHRLEKGSVAAGRREQARAGRIPADFHLSTCTAAARAGGRVLMHYWGRRGSYPVHEKGRNDYVTVVDREAEEAIVRLVRDRFPDHAILAEESAPRAGTAGYRWYIDPLDGTTNFVHGVPLFCVSVGVSDPQGLRAAAVYDPLRDEMFTAVRGMGAFRNGEPIRVAPVARLSQALLVTGIPFRSIDRLDSYLRSFRSFILGAAGIRRDGSAALDLSWVACGRYGGFWEMSLSPWDVAAGSLIVREAGGVVSDFQGRDGFLDSGDIIAAPPSIHPAMLRVVRESYRDLPV